MRQTRILVVEDETIVALDVRTGSRSWATK